MSTDFRHGRQISHEIAKVVDTLLEAHAENDLDRVEEIRTELDLTVTAALVIAGDHGYRAAELKARMMSASELN